MKPKQLLSITLLFVCGSLFSQNYLKVDQNPNAPTGDHVYSDLQACIDAASNGDIIHIIPAVEHYGDIVLNKSVHLVGAGWVPDNQSGTTSKINSITFDALTADGSTLNGIVFVLNTNFPIKFGVLNAPVDTLENIEIFNCNIASTLQLPNAPIKNMILRNNIFTRMTASIDYGHTTLYFNPEDGMTENLVISNNIIEPALHYSQHTTCLNAGNQSIIKNNIFYGGVSNTFYVIKDSYISNNVFYGTAPTPWGTQFSGSSTGNVFSNNLSYQCGSSCAFPPPATGTPANSGSGNIANTDPLFTNITLGWDWSVNFDLELMQFSPLENAGTDGTDIGISGGEYPFNNYRNLRGVPYVHQLNVSGVIMEGQDIQLDAVVRSNQ